jgi:transmembrane sensor
MSSESFYLLAAKVLSNEATPLEVADLEKIMAENQEWKAVFQNLEELWNTKPRQSTDQTITEEAYLLHLGKIKDAVNDFEIEGESTVEASEDFQLYPISRKWYQKWQSYAAITVLGIICVVSFRFLGQTSASPTLAENTGKHVNEINVNPGARSKVQLPDGSQVWVNSDSKLSYPESFKGEKREVFLEGEAYFDVVKDPSHPFIVHTSGIDIRVLGTAFNVKAYKAEPTIEATLVHGMIEVTKTNQPNASKVILKKHEKLIFDKNSEEPLAKTPAEKEYTSLRKVSKPAITITQLSKNLPDTAFLETSWVYNRLSFEEEAFENLALKMERWFNVKIIIKNEKIKSYKLTGSFENETIDEALRELQYLVSFTYKKNGREIVVTGK